MNFDEDKKLFLMIGADELKTIVENSVRKIMLELKDDTQQIDEWLTTFQVGKLLHVSKSTICNWRNSGKLESHKAGNRVLFKKEQVIAIINKIKIYKSEGELVH